MPAGAGHVKTKTISELESKGDENNLDETFMNSQPPSTLEELGSPVPAAPAATPVCVKQEIPTSNAATLEVLKSAPSSVVNSKLIDLRMTSFACCSDLQSTEFMPLMPIKDEPESEDVSDQLNIGSDDTNDSFSANEVGNRTSPKSWTSADMENALEALKSHHMSLTKASATYGIPSTTLWQRAHRLGIDTPKKEGSSKSWSEEDLNAALQALRDGVISANKASKAFGIPSSTLYKIARREGIRLAAPFNAAPTSWRRNDLNKALEAIRAGQFSVQRAATHFGIPSGTLYGRCKREGIGLSRSNPTPWSEDAMGEALEAVRVGQMSINQAAIHFNLPYSSLYGRFKRLKCPQPDFQQDTQIQPTEPQTQQDTQTNDLAYTQEHTHTNTHFFPHLYQTVDAHIPSTVYNEIYDSNSFSESAMYSSQGWYGIATSS